MASVLNIGGDSSDKFYRYKMPKLISKIEGKGNGIKTVIPNMSDISKALSRPPSYATKFFGFELGAQVKLETDKDRYIVNGAHDAAKLQTLLSTFIDKFVLCPACGNPETNLIINGDNITRDCQACGANLPVDVRHKLCQFIVKNPPAQKTKTEKQVAQRQIKGGTSLPTPDSNSHEDDGGDDDELTRRIEKEASQLDDVEVDDDDWAHDTSAEAVAARMKGLNVSAISKSVEDDDDIVDPIDEFADFVIDEKPTDDTIIAKAKALSIKDHKVCTVLAQVLFDGNILAQSQVAKRAALLKAFAKDSKSQKGLLGGVERFVSSKKVKDALMPKVSLVLKAFYDAELLDEEILLAWGDKSSDKYVKKKVNKELREKAAPFLNWLKEAEEEGDDDDDEDDE